VQTRGFVLERGFIDVSRDNAVRHDADLGQQGQAAGARGGEDQRGVAAYLNRNVMRPLVRS
jgi:hypothetical protein